MTPRVEIRQSGRAGSISYHEGLEAASFQWEFALSPALAIVCGPRSAEWDRIFPWAAGRQAEVYRRIAQEVVRQKAPDSRFELDLDEGVITILEPRRRTRTGRKRRKGAGPLDAVAELGDREVEKLIDMLVHDGISGRVVEALGQIDHPRARSLVEEAARDHLSVDTRLAAAEALHARGALADLESVLVREIKMLNRPADGLARALRLAEIQPTSAVKQALLWASWNATECAPECARLLLRLTAGAPALETMAAVLPELGLHSSYFERKVAFDILCQRTGMTLAEG